MRGVRRRICKRRVVGKQEIKRRNEGLFGGGDRYRWQRGIPHATATQHPTLNPTNRFSIGALARTAGKPTFPEYQAILKSASLVVVPALVAGRSRLFSAERESRNASAHCRNLRAGDGHPRSAHIVPLALAEWVFETLDRFDKARVH